MNSSNEWAGKLRSKRFKFACGCAVILIALTYFGLKIIDDRQKHAHKVFEADVRNSLADFNSHFYENRPTAALGYYSNKCQQNQITMDSTLVAIQAASVKQYDHELVSFSATRKKKNVAELSYRFADPRLSIIRGERWAKEGDRWKFDACDDVVTQPQFRSQVGTTR